MIGDELANDEGEKLLAAEAADAEADDTVKVDIDTYKPTILPDRRWEVSEIDLGQYPACKYMSIHH